MTIRHAEIAVSHKQKALKHTFPGVLKKIHKNKSCLALGQNSFTLKI